MENEASEQTLDHVLSHPFFAKKSSLQEKISTPKEGDGHDHSSETMNQYKGQHEKHGVDVTKSKPKKRPSESGIVDQQKNDVANDIDELVAEAQFNLSVGTSVAMKDKNKMLYGKVEKLEKVSGKPGVVVRWSNRQSGRFTMSSFAGLRMDKKADYIVSEEVAESCGCVGVVDAASNKAKKEANLFGTSPTSNSRPKLRGKRVFRTLRQQNEKQVDGRTKAYRETYSRIMNRNKAKSNGEST